ncbi:MAG: ABC transporter permease [Oscillospiraceae bacterium]|jgi:multidrug/hemolysin transport system permease protein|nr:ABC transporter permease [Oscillospiraceae bacterium]
MNHFAAFTKRNVKLFLRDKPTVFFSFLSAMVLIALYFLFIAKTYSTAMQEHAGDFLSLSASNFMIYLQMMAGVLVLNSMSLTTGAFGIIAHDFENRRVDSFLLTPLRTGEMLASYYAASIIVSFTLNVFTWLASSVLIGALTGYWITAATFFAGIGILVITSFISASLMLLITTLVKSSAAIGVISGIAGTFFGFLCGIYMPYSNFGEGTIKIGSTLPFTHLTIWLKQTVLADAFSQVGITGEMKDIFLKDFFSAGGVGFVGMDVPLWLMIVLCSVFALVCLTIARLLLKRRLSV